MARRALFGDQSPNYKRQREDYRALGFETIGPRPRAVVVSRELTAREGDDR
jgi:hypothetical protein